MKPKKDRRLAALAARMKLESDFLDECLRQGAFHFGTPREDAAAISAAEFARLRRLHRICHSLGVDVYAGSVIVELLERLDETQADLERLRAGAGRR